MLELDFDLTDEPIMDNDYEKKEYDNDECFHCSCYEDDHGRCCGCGLEW